MTCLHVGALRITVINVVRRDTQLCWLNRSRAEATLMRPVITMKCTTDVEVVQAKVAMLIIPIQSHLLYCITRSHRSFAYLILQCKLLIRSYRAPRNPTLVVLSDMHCRGAVIRFLPAYKASYYLFAWIFSWNATQGLKNKQKQPSSFCVMSTKVT